jgi:hypothetical protein
MTLPSVSLTAFGVGLLAIALPLAAWRPRWLPALLPVAAVFQAAAAGVVDAGDGAMGITSFNAVAALVALHWLLTRPRAHLPSATDAERRVTRLWLAFLAWCVAGAMLMPVLFAGVELYPLAVREAMKTPPAPLRWTISNLAQAVNATVIAALVLSLRSRNDRAALARTWWCGMAIALLAALGVGLFQRAAMLAGFDMLAGFWGSNPGYNQFFHTPEYGPAFGRVGLPFNEPSYASVWFAAAASACLAAFMYLREHRTVAVLLGAASLLGLANTVGTSGLIAFVLFALLLAVAQLSPLGNGAPRFSRRMALLILCGTMLASSFVLYQVTWGTAGWLAPLRDVTDWTLAKFSDNVDAQYRTAANRQAWSALLDTWGLGAGTGSARSSSYLFGLAANTGLPGVALFFTAFAVQAVALFRLARAGSPLAVWALGASGGILLGVLVGISDQNWPALWCTLLGGFVVARSRRCEAAEHRSILPAT